MQSCFSAGNEGFLSKVGGSFLYFCLKEYCYCVKCWFFLLSTVLRKYCAGLTSRKIQKMHSSPKNGLIQKIQFYPGNCWIEKLMVPSQKVLLESFPVNGHVSRFRQSYFLGAISVSRPWWQKSPSVLKKLRLNFIHLSPIWGHFLSSKLILCGNLKRNLVPSSSVFTVGIWHCDTKWHRYKSIVCRLPCLVEPLVSDNHVVDQPKVLNDVLMW
jgi:hypothetical protein